ncbi:MAG TPA: nucleotidyltransferase family protein [Anaerolineales bacterium]|nr:nucleotidyltransferase family protein [Anaerolineales bacterium]HNQ93321.1 nucleotidyltransferase family protein [Anaerolineales bacterium]HNS60709.1 nucleotidyltransferase family protein [Anaerolineales bacterium]
MTISAIILAAGESKRMGQPKMLLKWEKTTVLEHVISVFANAWVEDIVVVTGAARDEVEKIVADAQASSPVRSVFNENFSTGEMLSSIQCGLRELAGKGSKAALIALGDQPQVREGSVRRVCEMFKETGSPLVVPSYHMRRGHPWLAERSLWDEVLAMRAPQTPRDFLNSHADQINYVEVDDEGILADLDTPEQYQAYKFTSGG